MRTKKTVIVLISGKAGSGKTTAADILNKKLSEIPDMSVFRYAFAGPLKYIAQAFMGWNKQKDDKGRKLLQDIGKVGREYDEFIWVKHMLSQMDKQSGMFPFNFVIVDDWRFPNELNYLTSNPVLDVCTIRMFGRGGLEGDTASDVSENSLPEATAVGLKDNNSPYYDFVIDNSSLNTGGLESVIDWIVDELTLRYILK